MTLDSDSDMQLNEFREPREPRPCKKHAWERFTVLAGPNEGLSQTRCSRCGTGKDFAVVRQNRQNRRRGNGTSAQLAEYLHIEDVERKKLPWDVQGSTLRLQSKRDLLKRGPVAAMALIVAIPRFDGLRGLFHVNPGQRLTSGSLTFVLEEWVSERGWTLPPYCALSIAVGTALVTMPLSVFADLFGTEAAA